MTNKLSKLRLIPAREWEAKRLTRWLLEWDLLQSADERADEGPSCSADAPHTPFELAPGDSNAAIGQIRLMKPGGDGDQLLFMVVAQKQGEERFACVPFGVLSEPATPNELLSGRAEPVIRVFCLWNTRILMKKDLSSSWIVDQLDERELERLLLALKGYNETGKVPGELRSDAGPTLVHPADPRRAYLAYETTRVTRGIAESRAAYDPYLRIETDPTPRELPKAAEDRETYDT